MQENPRKTLIAPSVLSADFGALADGVRQAESMGGDLVHLDVMDGSAAIEAGADVIVAGSALFGVEDPAAEVAFLRRPW